MQPTPMISQATRSVIERDVDHLRLISIFHYIVGVLICLFASLFIFHVVIGIGMARSGNSIFQSGPAATNQTQSTWATDKTYGTAFYLNGPSPFPTPHASAPPTWFGYLFIVCGLIALTVGWSLGICTILSGRFMARRKYWLFSVITAGVLCAWFPFGTVLGVFTLVVLLRDSTKEMYSTVKSPITNLSVLSETSEQA